MKYKLIVFDFDGTVVDTGDGIIKSLVYALKKHSVPVPDEKFLRRFIGPPIYDSFINDYGATQENVHDFIKSYRERYFVKGIYECEVYEGVIHMLEEIKKAGCLIGIASSKPEKLIYDVMNYTGITPLFDAICGVDLDESKKKSKAELIMLCAEKLGVEDAKEILMVGDRFYDIDGAKKAGADSAGMLYGYGSREEFEEHKADYIFSSAAQLEAFLLS
ncbi:MAG: HAD-IA family hydrolase [Clostridia bacterium]|nr:HAD-IA family hydrolase [Clostridia bacterium]